jgi:hypothetical protein
MKHVDLPSLPEVVDLAHTWIFTNIQDGITHTPSENVKKRGKQNARPRTAA